MDPSGSCLSLAQILGRLCARSLEVLNRIIVNLDVVSPFTLPVAIYVVVICVLSNHHLPSSVPEPPGGAEGFLK